MSVQVSLLRLLFQSKKRAALFVLGQARTIFHALILVAILAPEAVPVLLPKMLDHFVESFRDGKGLELVELIVFDVLVLVLHFVRKCQLVVCVFRCVILTSGERLCKVIAGTTRNR